MEALQVLEAAPGDAVAAGHFERVQPGQVDEALFANCQMLAIRQVDLQIWLASE